MAALLLTPTLKLALSISTTDGDALLDIYVAAAIKRVNTFLGYDPTSTGATVVASPNAGQILTIPRVGPNSTVTVTTVHEDWTNPPTFDATTLLVAGTDYTQQAAGSSTLVRLNANWPAQVRVETDRLGGTLGPLVGTVQIIYTVDYSAVLAEAKLVALFEAMALWNRGTAGFGLGFVTGESVDGLSEKIDMQFGPARKGGNGGFSTAGAADRLDDYRLPLIG